MDVVTVLFILLLLLIAVYIYKELTFTVGGSTKEVNSSYTGDTVVLCGAPHHRQLQGGLSPFALKLEAYLRFADIDYKRNDKKSFDCAPKGKIPFIEHRGKALGDSSMIIEYLKTIYGDPLDGGLSAEEKAHGELVQSFAEDRLYFIVVFQRWILDTPKIKRIILRGMAFVAPIILRSVNKMLYYQGIGRHSTAEINAIGNRTLDTLSTILGDKKYFVGKDSVTSYDLAVYGQLAQIVHTPWNDCQLAAHMTAKTPNLVAFVDRVHDQFKARAKGAEKFTEG